MKKKLNTLLICGVMGHIGYMTAIAAIKKNYRVIGIYNSSNDNQKFTVLENLKVKLIKNDLQDQNTLKKIFKKYSINNCIYAAAVSHEIFAKKNPKKTLKANCIGVENILSIIDKKIKFIYLSSGSVFQDIKNQKKINENQIPTPTSLYSGTKRLGEIIVNFYRDNYDKNCTTLRVSWVYGPPIICRKLNIQRGPIPFLLFKFVKNQNLFKIKSGSDFRASFTYIDDVSETLLYLLSKNRFISANYNLGTGKNNTISEFMIVLNKIRKIKYTIGKGTLPWSESSVIRGPITSKFKDIKAIIELKKGIRKYLEWLNKNA